MPSLNPVRPCQILDSLHRELATQEQVRDWIPVDFFGSGLGIAFCLRALVLCWCASCVCCATKFALPWRCTAAEPPFKFHVSVQCFLHVTFAFLLLSAAVVDNLLFAWLALREAELKLCCRLAAGLGKAAAKAYRTG